MLNHEGAKKGSKNMPTDSWTPDELDLVAAELKLRFPKKGFTFYHSLEFTPDQVEEAAESVLPQHRHKSISDYHDIRRPMFDAFSRIGQPPGKRPALAIVPGNTGPGGSIKWSPQEWEAVILELHQVCPTGFDERLKNVNISHVRLAMEVLEIPRRRQFKQIVGFKEQALRTWDDLPIDVKDPSKAERAIVDFPSGPVMAPPLTSKTKQNPTAAALQKAFTEPPKPVKKAEIPVITEKPRKKRVSWTSEEWLMIAREMYRQDPFGNLLTSTFPRLDLGAMRAAQRKIFTWDNHKALKNPTGLREPLIEAFAALKLEIASQKPTDAAENQVKAASAEVPMSPAEVAKQNRIKSLAKANAERAKLSPEERRASTLKGHATRLAKKAKLAGVVTEVVAKTPEEVKPVSPVVQELAKSSTIRPPVETAPAAQEPQFIHSPASEMAFFGKVLNAATPLMNVLIDEAVSRLAPTLISGLLPQLEKSLGGLIHAAVASQMPKMEAYLHHQAAQIPPKQIVETAAQVALAPVEPEQQVWATARAEDVAKPPERLSKAELAQYLPQPIEKAKKPKIAMLMSLGPQREQIRFSFPEYEFVFIDHGHGIKDAAKSCVLFVAVEKFVNSNNRQQIKAYVAPEILKYVDGGVSAIKRQIHVWKAQQPK